MARSPAAVLRFWFGEEAAAAPRAAAVAALSQEEYLAGRLRFWFSGSREVDEACRTFEPLVRLAGTGQLEAESPGEWGGAAGRLAQIILLDQITRNVFRGSAEAFRFDGRAQELSVALAGDAEAWAGLALAEQSFATLPMLHSESLELHDQARRLLRGLAGHHAGSRFLAISLAHLDDHSAVLRRFQRYPHRNPQLGRADTAAEAAWLASPDCPPWALSQRQTR